MAQAAVKVMAGEELGLAPVASMMGIHIIKGKVSLSANLIAAQVRRHGYDYRHVQFDNSQCVLEFYAKDGKTKLGQSSFSEVDAKQAGVWNDMYKKFPRNMYFSRAMSNGAKWYCPEVMSGLPIYTPEELGAKVDGEGNVVAEEKPIDTGGHAVGTQAAADHVAEKKVAEMREGRARTAPQPQRSEAKGGAPPAPPPATTSPQYTPDETALRARIVDMKSMIAVLAELRKDLSDLMGSESAARTYYSELERHGVKHANEFKSTKPARDVAVAFHRMLRDGSRPVDAVDAVDAVVVDDAVDAVVVDDKSDWIPDFDDIDANAGEPSK